MNTTYNVSFVCDYMVVLTSVDVDTDTHESDIALMASEYVKGNYGFDPLELSYDYEVNEV